MLLFLQHLFLMLTFKFPWLCHHRLSSLCSVTQWCIPPSSVPPFKCSGDSTDLFVSLDSRQGLHPGFICKNQCFAVLVLNVNFKKSSWFVTQQIFIVPTWCQVWATRHKHIIKQCSFMELTVWRGGKWLDTWRIPLQALIATVLSSLKEKLQVVGEHVNLWNAEPDLGSEEGFLMRPMSVVRFKAECRGEADHLQDQAEKP